MPQSEPSLQWTGAMATGIATVDAQHQYLLDIFNRIAAAQARSTAHAQIPALIGELVEYTRYHFGEEEQLMRRWAVHPGHAAMHLRAHATFCGVLRRAQSLVTDHVSDVASDVAVDLLAFLAQWLVHHIMEVDRALALEIGRLERGEAVAAPAHAVDAATPDDLLETVNLLMDRLGARAFDHLIKRQQLLDLQGLYRALLHCGDVLIHSRDDGEMLSSLCGKLAHDTPFHTAWIGRPTDEGVFEVLAVAGAGAEQVRSTPPVLTEAETASIAVKAWRSRQMVVCNDTFADPTLRPWHAGFAQHRWTSVLALPVMRAKRVWAVLTLASPRRGCFDPPTIEVSTRIAALLGHGLDELDLKRRIRSRQERDARIARTDALTGLPNRLALEEYLPQAVARARRRRACLAVGILDLDDFKPVNDHLGHEAGDELLRALSCGLLAQLRDSDFIARLGGDEFVIVFEDLEPAQTMAQLEAALDRLHRAVEAPFALEGGNVAAVDMTMGVAVYPGDGDEGELLLRQADAAMFQAKQNKRTRVRWWQLGVGALPEQSAEAALDPFGADVQELMRGLEPHLDVLAAEFSASFYRQLASHPDTATILGCLLDSELRALTCKQAEHLRFLLGEHTTAQSVAEAALRLGAVHALIGVPAAAMAHAMGLYRNVLRSHLDSALLTARTRYRTMRAAEARLQLDIESQLQAMQATLDQYQMLLARPLDGRTLAAQWMQAELNALAALPGIRAAVVYRPDVQNRLVIEHAAGEQVTAFLEAHRTRDLYPVLDPREARGRGMVATTWLTDCAQEVTTFDAEERLAPWQALMQEFGMRSAVTVPVHRHGALHAVLMLFGAYPCQFSSAAMRTWRLSLQNRWDQMTRASQSRWSAIDTGEAAGLRALLYAGGVQMFVQPVVDLRTGTVIRVEALARLRTPGGAIVPPGQFLPALGETDLDSLFRQGLTQSLAQLRQWRDENLDIGVSINLAPSSLVHPDCAGWVREALRSAQVDPQHLTLELLENEALEISEVDAAIARLAATGVKIAIDDLGAGFSNLKRLADLPFDVIKVDQNIMRDVGRDPLKVLSLFRAVVQIGQDLERDVVAEGLEDAGTVEAAGMLGCRLGQGFGIARPMPAPALTDWLKTQPFHGVDSVHVSSWIGALAYQWMAMHDTRQLRHPGDLLSCPITGFLAAQDIADPELQATHRQIHDHPLRPVRLHAMRRMTHWMIGKTHALYAARCEQALVN
jgi:diguanylate cyclase (GGDEF)-like protein/hemerythrin-like metal-binding protein